MGIPRPPGKTLPGPDATPSRDGDKRQSRMKVYREILNGRLPHPNTLPCVDCAHVWKEGDPRHTYDHHKGYAAQYHIDVVAVCSMCHAARDNPKKKQTHCVNGHEFTPENTFVRKADGTRSCRKCGNACNLRRYYERKRNAGLNNAEA